MLLINSMPKAYLYLCVLCISICLEAVCSQRQGDTCVGGGNVRGVCTSYHFCKSAQIDSSNLFFCNTQDRQLICCTDRIELERDYVQQGSNKLKNGFPYSTHDPISEEKFDDIETIVDVKKALQEPTYLESGRKKHSISVSHSDRQRKPGSQQAYYYPSHEPNNVQPSYIQQNKPETFHSQTPTNDLSQSQEQKQINRFHQTTTEYYSSSHKKQSNQHAIRPTNGNQYDQYYEQTTRYRPQPVSFEIPNIPNAGYNSQSSSHEQKNKYPSSIDQPHQPPSIYNPQIVHKPTSTAIHRPTSYKPPTINSYEEYDSSQIVYPKPTQEPKPRPHVRPSTPRPTRPTAKYTHKPTQSPWQQPARPLVEDENGYPVFQTTTSTRRPRTTKRPTTHRPKPVEKTISDIKCQEYSELVTETIAGLPLTTDPKPVEINVQKCNYNAHQLIVGGQNASVGEFPHMAAVGFFDRRRRNISWDCGGSLISEHFVLTAAHCTTTAKGSPSVVRLGEHNLHRADDGAHPVDYLVKQVVRHPNYKPPLRYNDIALLRLSRSVAFTINIRPACLHTKTAFDTEKAVAMGWGRIEYAEDQSDVLQKVVLSIINNEECNKLYKSESKTEVLSQGIIDDLVCAGELSGGKDTCQGDSGGPIEITSRSNQCVHYVIGVTSFGKRCGQPHSAGVYTRVSSYITWIESVVWPDLAQRKTE